ncbi:M56 family metallopeptidase [Aeromicrobium alkaliterrae]|uniref:M56 family metallopeptidase n=1 Tax=Aeromicrobium alkaliterrae TaxID=302168 RepID=A0ABP4VSD9_9ACTN
MSLTVALVLLAVALTSGWTIDRALRRAQWVEAAPGRALAVWHLAAVSMGGSVVAVGALLTHDALEHVMFRATGVSEDQLHQVYAGGIELSALWNATAVIVLAGLAALVFHAAATTRATHHSRRRLHDVLDRREVTTLDGFDVVPGDRPFAYCIPAGARRRSRVVVSSTARQLLSADELAAVVAHERSHLSRRHHRAVFLAEVFTRTARPLRILPSYAEEVRRLVELQADDDASLRTGRVPLARALVTMASPVGPSGTLAMAGSAVGERVGRMLRRPRHDRRLTSSLLAVAALAALAPPATIGLPALYLALGA